MSGPLFGQQTTQTPATQSNFANLPSSIQNLATTGANFLTGQVGASQPYNYAMAAPLSSGQNQGISAGNYLAGDLALAPATANTVGNIISGGNIGAANPAIANILQGLQQSQNQAQSTLQNQYGDLGLANSQGLANASGNLSSEYAGQAGQVALQGVEAGLQQQIQALPYATDLPQQAYQNLLTQGGTQQATMQNYLTDAYNQWLQQQQQAYQAVDLSQPTIGSALTSQQPLTTQTTPSIFSQLLSGAADAAELGAFA